ncbi:MAG: MFS transporter [Gammaproteobacteria bacterium]
MSKSNRLIFLAPLLSILVLVLGNGVSVSLTTVIMNTHAASNISIAVVSSMGFLGVILGSCICQSVIIRTGHVRAYMIFALLCMVACIGQGLIYNVPAWVVFRLLNGISLAGMYIIIESWLLGLSNSENRGRVLGVYMLSFYAGQSMSQWLLDIPGATALFLLSVIAFCTAVSIVPLISTRFTPPKAEATMGMSVGYVSRRALLGVAGCLGSGMILSVIYSFVPKFLIYVGHGDSVADAMFAVILGGTLMQYPIGKMSDKFDRRWVLAFASLACALVGGLIALHYQNLSILIPLCFLLGGSSFLIYPISIAYTVDRMDPGHVLVAVSVLYIVYAVGSVVGPLLVVPFLYISDLTGYFIYIGIAGLGLAVACLFDRLHVPQQPVHEVDFVPVPQTSIEAPHLDPRVHEEGEK